METTETNKRVFNTETFFLDYANNYLTVELIAEHNRITVKDAEILIREGRKVNNNLPGFKNVQLNANILY